MPVKEFLRIYSSWCKLLVQIKGRSSQTATMTSSQQHCSILYVLRVGEYSWRIVNSVLEMPDITDNFTLFIEFTFYVALAGLVTKPQKLQYSLNHCTGVSTVTIRRKARPKKVGSEKNNPSS